ncbi:MULTISPECIES: CsbD family protein [Sporosarcina]|uniref:CsbD family protein n=1 Tax=Sporosarcina contaminans TaxID=633403 RepID=A0ABW3U0H6_9BACL
MKDNSYSDKIKGAVNKTKGELKDQVGNATDDAMLQAEGKFDKLKGEAQKEAGKLKDRVSENHKKW